MSDEKVGFEVQGKSTFDASGTDAAAAGLHKVKGAAKETETASEALAEAGKKIKEAFLEFFAVAELFAQLKEGVEEMMLLEQSFRELDRSAARFNQNGAKVREELEGFAQKLAKVAGIADEESVPALVRLYSATGEMELVQKRAALATDIHIATGKSFAESLGLVNAAAGGNVRALRDVQIYMQSTGDKTKDADLALKELVARFGGAADNAGGLRVELNRLKAEYDEMRGSIVERVVPAFLGLWNVIKSIVLTGVAGFNSLMLIIKGAGDGIAGIGKALWEVLHGNFKAAGEALKGATRDMEDDAEAGRQLWKKYGDDVVGIWSKTDDADKKLGVDRTQRHGKIIAEEKAEESHLAELKLKLLQEQGRKREALDLEEQIALSKITGKTKDAEAERDATRQLYAQKRINLERDIEEKTIAAMTKASKRMEDIVKKYYDQRAKEAEDAAKAEEKRAAALAIQEQKIEEAKYKNLKSIDDRAKADRARIQREKLQDIEHLKKEGVEAKEAEVRATALADEKIKALDRSVAQAKVAVTFQALGMLSGALQDAFGESKELSIAMAIINTAQSIIGFLANPGGYPGIALAAVAAATGALQIAKIENTDYSSKGDFSTSGKGFDVPANDYAAYQAGYAGSQRWAGDMVREFSKGIATGWAETMRGARLGGVTNQTTIDNRRTSNINVHAGVLDSSDVPGLKRLHRQLLLIAKLDDQRRL